MNRFDPNLVHYITKFLKQCEKCKCFNIEKPFTNKCEICKIYYCDKCANNLHNMEYHDEAIHRFCKKCIKNIFLTNN